jgi:hypothetical protein
MTQKAKKYIKILDLRVKIGQKNINNILTTFPEYLCNFYGLYGDKNFFLPTLFF